MSIGNNVICALQADTSAICWGADNFGQTSPVSGAGTGIARVFAGDDRPLARRSNFRPTCLVYADGTLRCFGGGASLGNRDAWAHPAP